MCEWRTIAVICEGETEALFVKQILNPHFQEHCIDLQPILMGGKNGKGGNVSFPRFKKHIENCLKDSNYYYRVSSFIDYYGRESMKNWPEKELINKQNDSAKKAREWCKAIAKEVDLYKFIPYISMYEFEALLFSDAKKLAEGLKKPKDSEGLQPKDSKPIEKILTEFKGEPEEINNSLQTAPSKRIQKLCPNYKKTGDGIEIAKAIGLEQIRKRCPIFNGWLDELESHCPKVP